MVVYLLHRECFERALEIFEKFYGHQHQSVAVMLVNLGSLWMMKGDKDKAISHHQEALAIEKEMLGPNHLKVSYHSLIRILKLQIGRHVSKPELSSA